QRAGLQRERLAQQLHRPVDVRAVEQERDELAARLGVVEAERERLLELGHRLVVAAQTPVRAGGRTVRAGEVGSRLRGVDSRQGGTTARSSCARASRGRAAAALRSSSTASAGLRAGAGCFWPPSLAAANAAAFALGARADFASSTRGASAASATRSEKPSRPWLCAIFTKTKLSPSRSSPANVFWSKRDGCTARSSWSSFPFSHT